MKLAILGGSFNPVHIGHIALANLVLEQFNYDKICFIPAFSPPHKTLANGATSQNRLDMLQLATQDNKAFSIETCELERKGTSYTIDTIYHLQEKYKDTIQGKIGLIMGDDLLKGFHLWKDADKLSQLVDILLASRIHTKNQQESILTHTHQNIQNTVLDVSSQMIRTNIQNNKDWRNLVHNDVFDYILSRNLYYVHN